MPSFAEVIKTKNEVSTSPDLKVGTFNVIEQKESEFCPTVGCKHKKVKGENLCFDCYSKLNKKCKNFDTCSKFMSKISDVYCLKCKKDIESRCSNYDICKNRSFYDKVNNKYMTLCSQCHKDNVSRCFNYEMCGKRRLYIEHLERYSKYCKDCHLEFVSRCNNFETCGGRKFFDKKLHKFSKLCESCFSV